VAGSISEWPVTKEGLGLPIAKETWVKVERKDKRRSLTSRSFPVDFLPKLICA
jgi:hypothetical protein